MSHVTSIDVEITDLEALAQACDQLDLELVQGQATYRWFGRSVGDYPLPPGFTAADLGKCEHAIRVKGDEGATAYEIGLVARRDGRPGYTLLFDHYAGGCGLMKRVSRQSEEGEDVLKLVHEYGAVKAARLAARRGLRVAVQRSANGTVQQMRIYR